ncbi:hypothetical protein ACFV0H_40165 [Streptomyces erythrochromogenes]|uniref:hypothetical protein n=1 Tax=Streptomyces erythrochromogenes TaxID=285574 RepID=UPI003696DB5E
MLAKHCTVDDEATARAFIAYYFHDIASTAAEEGDAFLARTAAAERSTWEERGTLHEVTVICLLIWAFQRALIAGRRSLSDPEAGVDYEQAKEDAAAVERWLDANGYLDERRQIP